MLTNEEILIKLIIKYFKNLEKCEEIIKYLYNHTELFEQKYMSDFPEDLFRFFAGKIGTYARQKNKVIKIMTKKQIEKMKLYELMEE